MTSEARERTLAVLEEEGGERVGIVRAAGVLENSSCRRDHNSPKAGKEISVLIWIELLEKKRKKQKARKRKGDVVIKGDGGV